MRRRPGRRTARRRGTGDNNNRCRRHARGRPGQVPVHICLLGGNGPRRAPWASAARQGGACDQDEIWYAFVMVSEMEPPAASLALVRSDTFAPAGAVNVAV